LSRVRDAARDIARHQRLGEHFDHAGVAGLCGPAAKVMANASTRRM
jgi:hypothetical protein